MIFISITHVLVSSFGSSHFILAEVGLDYRSKEVDYYLPKITGHAYYSSF